MTSPTTPQLGSLRNPQPIDLPDPDGVEQWWDDLTDDEKDAVRELATGGD